MNNAAFRSKWFQFTGKIFTNRISISILLQAEDYRNAYTKENDDDIDIDDDIDDDIDENDGLVQEKELKYLSCEDIGEVGKRS